MRHDERLAAQAEIFGTLFLLAQHVARRADSDMEPVGLTTKQWLLLAILLKGFPGRTPTLSEAAARYGTSRQNIKQIALQLEKRGFLELVADPQDRRAIRLKVTPQIAELDTPSEHHRQADMLEALFVGLEDQDLASLQGLFRRWLTGLTTPARREGEDHA